jgi:hypothetical protein
VKLARVLVSLALAVPLALASTLPANAVQSDCDGTIFSPDNSREYITPDLRFVPPPLRVVPPDCVSKVPSYDFRETPGDIAYSYDMLWVDVTWEEFVGVVRAFENEGWGQNLVTSIDFGEGSVSLSPGYSADQLAALSDPIVSARGRFSDIRTGEDIIAITYTDGVNASNDLSLDGPSLVVNVIGTRLFGASGFGDPSVLSHLRTIQDAAPTPTQAAVAGGSAIMLMLIVGWPGQLLSAVIKARYDQVAAWLRARRSTRPAPAARKKRELPGWLMWPGFVLASIIGGFVDPDYGFNPMSARVLLSSLISFVIFNLSAWMLTRAILLRVQPDSKPYIKFRWGSLLILLFAVIVARLLQFDPGVIFGLVTGLAFGLTLAAARDALVALLGTGFGLAVALIAWIAYSVLAPLVASVPGNPALVFVSELFAGLTVQGISSLPLALLPFAVLNGGKIFRYKRWLWAVAYSVGLAAFMLVLLTVPRSWGEIAGDFGRWVLLFVVFGVLAIGVWLIDTRLAKRRKQSAAAVAAPAS